MVSFIAVFAYSQTMLPDFYHRYSDVETKILGWQTEYPNRVKVEKIGYSQLEGIPLYAVKLAWNVEIDADKPAILVAGQIHAEEVMGLEVVMEHIQRILQNQNQNPYRRWLQNLELWFIPTLNPEGHNVVTEGLDLTYRKNKRDNNGNGIFDYVVGKGYDIDGVDLNRNFPFNWVHGDSLYHFPPGVNEPYDYYRGPQPGSESELHGLMSLLERKHFVYSIIWHSSRSGNFSEKVYYPFNWYNCRPSPDMEIAKSLGDGVAANIMKFGSGQSYENLPSLSRTGNAHDWFYKQHGTLQLMIECGTATIQPKNQQVLMQIVNECINGESWLFDRALDGHLDRSPMLTGHIKDAVTGEPLQAEVIIEEQHASYLTPRMSDEKYGRFWRPLTAGSYTVTVRKEGYVTQTIERVAVNNSGWKRIQVNLEPIPEALLKGTLTLNGTPVNGEIAFTGLNEKTVYADDKGKFEFNGYEGEIEMRATAEGAYPYIGKLILKAGLNEIAIDLSPEYIVFQESWEDECCRWVIQGPWKLISANSMEGFAIVDSWDGGNNFYEPNADVNITTNFPISLASYVEPNYQTPYLIFWQNLYTVWDYDFVLVQASTDLEEWTTLYKKSGQYDYWHPVYVSLEEMAGKEFFLRFRLTADTPDPSLVDPGWIIDNIKIVSGKATLSNIDKGEETVLPITKIKLGQNYPNPFNPETTFSYNLKSDASNSAEIRIYNVKGALVDRIPLSEQDQNSGKVLWNATAQSSGIYFYSLYLNGKAYDTKKAILLK